MASRKINPGRNLPLATAVGLGLLGLLFASLAFDRWFFTLYVVVLAIFATRELTAMYAAKGIAIHPIAQIAVPLAIANSYREGIGGGVVCLVVAIVIGWIVQLKGGVDGFSERASAFTFVLVYVGAALSFAADLARGDNGLGLIWTVVLLTAANDTGGYFAGILAGKHPLSPTISPKKSWEGLAGSFALSMAVGAFALPYMIPIEWWQGVLVGALLVVTGTFGDLVESAIKRDTGLKDSGTVLPGHGGVLDRLDSLLVNAPIAWVLLVWIMHVS